MACFRPLRAFRLEDGVISFGAPSGAEREELLLPCGKCDGCRLERSRQWAIRCMHERQLHESNSFITLTYDDSHLPCNDSLYHRDWQLFAKRLRKKYGPFRFFMCGEYGGLNGRPHFHACLFGVGFDDRVKFRESDCGSDVFTSKSLDSVWSKGFASVGDVTFESAAYVARYTLKKVGNDVERLGTVDFSTGEIHVKVPEYARMSLRPAIARDWWARFSGDVKRRGDIVIRGRSMRPPRYYDKLLEVDDPDLLDAFKRERLLKVNPEDGTPERLKVQEIVCKGALNFKKRSTV